MSLGVRSEIAEQSSDIMGAAYDKEVMSKRDLTWWKSNGQFETKEQNCFNEVATMLGGDISLDDYVENNTTKEISRYLVAVTNRLSSVNLTDKVSYALDAVLIIYESLIHYDELKARTSHTIDRPTQATKYLRKMAADAFIAAYETDPNFRATFENAKAEHKKAIAQHNALIASQEINAAAQAKNMAMKQTAGARPKDNLARFGPLKDGGVYSALFKILKNQSASPFHIQKTSYILSGLLSTSIEPSHPAIRMFIQWVNTQLEENTIYVPQALNALKNLLKSRSTHLAFEIEDGVRHLANLIHPETKQLQNLYIAGFCVWLVSFNVIFDQQIHESHIVAKLLNLVRVVAREKVTRISLLTLVNLLERSEFAAEMIGTDVTKIMATLKLRKSNDDEITKMISTIESTIRSKMSEFSSFDKYLAELNAGALRKSPVHTEKFWSENCMKFEDDDYALVKRIVDQLSSDDRDSVEMACYDLGEFARFHPEGKKVLGGDAKNKLMVHMSNKDANISKAALLAVQKLLIQKWENVALAVKQSK